MDTIIIRSVQNEDNILLRISRNINHNYVLATDGLCDARRTFVMVLPLQHWDGVLQATSTARDFRAPSC